MTTQKHYVCVRGGKYNLLCIHLLGQQLESQRLKETEQTDKGWLCAGDCSGTLGADCTKKNAAQVNESREQH